MDDIKKHLSTQEKLAVRVLEQADEITTLRAQVETLTRERDEQAEGRAAENRAHTAAAQNVAYYKKASEQWQDGHNAQKYHREIAEEKVRRLVECVRKIESARHLDHPDNWKEINRLLATVSDITAPTDGVK